MSPKGYNSAHQADIDLVERLCAIESGLTPWEVEFAEDLAVHVEHRELTMRQRAKVEDILERLER